MRFKSRPRALVGAAAAGLLGLAGLTTVAPSAGASTRLEGATRFGTAVDLALATCDTNADGDCLDGGETPPAEVTIVNAFNFPDAMTAAAYGDPILLTSVDSPGSVTLNAINALGDPDFRVVGGSGVVSSAAVGEIVDEGATFLGRVAGATRIETALGVASANLTGSTVFLANANTFADALGAGAAAAVSGVPILLTNADSLADSTYQFLLDNDITDVIILGGPAAVSQDVEDELVLFDVTRLAGADRYATNLLLAEYLVATGAPFADITDAGLPIIATGERFPDALAGGPLAAYNVANDGATGPLLLTPSDALGADAEDFLTNTYTGPSVPGPTLLGGPAALSAQVKTDVDAATAVAGTTGTVINNPNDNTTTTFTLDDGKGGTTNYDADTDFTTYVLNGSSSTLAAVTVALSNGDTATVNGTTLTLTDGNGAAGLVGHVEVDTTANTGTFDIVTTSNNTITGPYTIEAGTAYSIDGDDTATVGDLADDVSLGDTIVMTDGADGGTAPDDVFTLTNGTLTGPSDSATIPFAIGLLGDNPLTANDATFDPAGTAKQSFTVDGAPVSVGIFEAQMDVKETVSYSRSGDMEMFALTNGTATAVDGSFTVLSDVEDADDAPASLDVFRPSDPTITAAELSTAGGGDPITYFIGNTAVTSLEDIETFLLNLPDGVAPFGHRLEFTDGDTADSFRLVGQTSTPLLAISGWSITSDNAATGDTVTVEAYGSDVYTFGMDDDYSTTTTTPVRTYTVNGSTVSYVIFEDYLLDLGAGGAEAGGDFFNIDVTSSGTTFNLVTNNSI